MITIQNPEPESEPKVHVKSQEEVVKWRIEVKTERRKTQPTYFLQLKMTQVICLL